jgi:hypothetical protein
MSSTTERFAATLYPREIRLWAGGAPVKAKKTLIEKLY